MEKNEIFQLEITGITNEGNGVGHHEGMAVFVPDTAAGDVGKVRAVKVLSRYAYGRMEELMRPSPDRVDPGCPQSRRCGGCSLRHLSYKAEKREKWAWVRDAFQRIGGFEDVVCRPLISTNVTEGYRNKAMLPVQRTPDGRVKIGFYAKRSHEIIECDACRLQPPEFARITAAVRRWLEECRISCYDERTGKGLVRHLYLRKAFVTGELMVCLVVSREEIPQRERLFALLDEPGLPVASVSINVNPKRTNVILGERTIVLRGADAIEDVLCGVRVWLQPQSFYQVNHDAAQLLYAKAAEYAALSGKETLVDLYCGAGTIGLSMAGKVRELIGVEEVEKAVEDARHNARICGVDHARFVCADAGQAAEQFVREGVRPDVVVVDPPRKGCSVETLRAVDAMLPARIVMISCNPASAARDCRLLADMGWVLREVTPVDLFPRTGHVETVALLQRGNS